MPVPSRAILPTMILIANNISLWDLTNINALLVKEITI